MRESVLANDEQARAAALNPERSFIVQAPAGSGKTELLIQRYLRLLSGVDFPEEVLAITFTNKAAAEMRVRVVAALRRATAGNAPEAAHERLTFDLASAVMRRAGKLGWHIDTNTSRLRIQTLDSLNALIAGMQPLTTSAATAGNSIPGEAQLEAIYERAAGATLDHLAEPGLMAAAAATVLRHLDSNTELYIRYLSAMLRTRDQWLPLIGGQLLDPAHTDGPRRILEATLENIVTTALTELRGRLPAAFDQEMVEIVRFAAGNLWAAGQREGLAALKDIDRLPGTEAADAPAWDAIRSCFLRANGEAFRRVDKRHGFPADSAHDKAQKKRFAELLGDLKKVPGLLRALDATRVLPPPAYSDEQWSVLTALLNLLRLATVELQRLFRARGALDYIEVAMNADDALGTPDAPGDVALLLDYRLRHILVDEMQDTSIAQYRMLEALTAGWVQGDGRTLFCVGDPMQSIYRFRNAEVAQFLLARDEGIGQTRLQSLVLQRNFRSGSSLVDWFNEVFPAVMAEQDDVENGAVSYASSLPAEHLEGQGAVEIHPVLGADEAAEAAVTCTLIRDLIARYPNDDIAVLVRGRGQLRELVPLLREHDVDFRAVDIDRLTDLPEIIDVLALTRAVVHPGDRHAWLGFLRAPWIGLSWKDLHALVRNDSRSTVANLLTSSERNAALSADGREAISRALPVIEGMLSAERSSSLRHRVEALWMTLGGATVLNDRRVVENVYRYFEVLSTLEESGTLVDVAQLEAQLDKERVSTTSDARLQIMTMHKSKGLQFDHVILHGLGRRPAANRPQVLHWMDGPISQSGERRILAPVGRRDDVEKDRIHQYIAEINKQKEQFEKQRLLYVACTRAKSSLHLVGHTNVDEEDESVRPPEAASLLRLLWPQLEQAFDEALASGQSARRPHRDVEWLLPRLRRLDAAWRPPSPPPVPLRVASPASGDDSVEFYWAGSGAKIAGILAHRWLQLAADDVSLLAPDRQRERLRLGKRWLAEQGFLAEAADTVLQRVEQAVAGVHADERGRWVLSGQGHVELALSGVVDGKVETRIIDRVRIDGDEHWLVDYKTSTHEGGNLDRFLSEEKRRYTEQLTNYARLYQAWSGVRPRVGLYFPLLQQFVEVEYR